MTLSELEQALGTQDFFRMQQAGSQRWQPRQPLRACQGRFFVALGLAEAEHLRGALCAASAFKFRSENTSGLSVFVPTAQAPHGGPELVARLLFGTEAP